MSTRARLAVLLAAVPLAATVVAVSSPPAQAAVPAAGTTYTVSVAGRCFDITAGSRDNGGLLQQWNCTNDAWQQFTLTSGGSGVYNLVNVNSGKCLDVPNGSTGSGVRLWQWT